MTSIYFTVCAPSLKTDIFWSTLAISFTHRIFYNYRNRFQSEKRKFKWFHCGSCFDLRPLSQKASVRPNARWNGKKSDRIWRRHTRFDSEGGAASEKAKSWERCLFGAVGRPVRLRGRSGTELGPAHGKRDCLRRGFGWTWRVLAVSLSGVRMRSGLGWYGAFSEDLCQGEKKRGEWCSPRCGLEKGPTDMEVSFSIFFKIFNSMQLIHATYYGITFLQTNPSFTRKKKNETKQD